MSWTESKFVYLCTICMCVCADVWVRTRVHVGLLDHLDISCRLIKGEWIEYTGYVLVFTKETVHFEVLRDIRLNPVCLLPEYFLCFSQSPSRNLWCLIKTNRYHSDRRSRWKPEEADCGLLAVVCPVSRRVLSFCSLDSIFISSVGCIESNCTKVPRAQIVIHEILLYGRRWNNRPCWREILIIHYRPKALLIFRFYTRLIGTQKAVEWIQMGVVSVLHEGRQAALISHHTTALHRWIWKMKKWRTLSDWSYWLSIDGVKNATPAFIRKVHRSFLQTTDLQTNRPS